MLQCHPDKNVGHEEQANSVFHRVKAAYEVLTDARSRELYDAARRAASAAVSAEPDDPADDVDSDEWANASDEGSVGSVDSTEWADRVPNSENDALQPDPPCRKEQRGPSPSLLNSAIQIARAKAKAETDALFTRARLEAEAAEAGQN